MSTAALLPAPPPRQEAPGVAGGAHACRRPLAAVVTPADQDCRAYQQRLPPKPYQQETSTPSEAFLRKFQNHPIYLLPLPQEGKSFTLS